MATDTPRSVTQMLERFEFEMNAAKAAELSRSEAVLRPGSVPLSDLVGVTRRTPGAIAEWYADFEEELAETIGTIIGGSQGTPGTIGDLQAAAMQGDILATMRRAMSLRYASRVRRSVHAARRRFAHGTEGGYIDRRLVTPIANRLKAGKQ